jgi:hypothetical protein
VIYIVLVKYIFFLTLVLHFIRLGGMTNSTSEAIRQQYESFGRHISERDRRLWAASIAITLSLNITEAINLVVGATGISYNTIWKGIKELEAGEKPSQD